MPNSTGGVTTGGRSVGDDERPGVRTVAAGVVAGLGAFFLVRHLVVDEGFSLARLALELPFVLLSVGLIYAGWWLLSGDVPHRRIGRVAACSLAGFLGLTAVAGWFVGGQGLPLQRSLLLAMDAGTVGASTGLLVGLEGERRDRNTGEVALAAERAEERFAFMNRLLRHHVLNGVAVVRGHAELLDETLEEPPEEVGVIRQRSDELVGLVQNVETLGRAFTGDLPTEPIDTADPIRNAVESVRRERPAVEIATDLRAGRPVVANERLALAFEALLRFSVERAADGSVSVSTATTDDAVIVTYDFDGTVADLDRPEVASGGRTELGLFLAENLIEYFGGSVSVTDDAAAGVTVRLPAAG